MDGGVWGGCQLPLQCTVGRMHGEPHDTECCAMHASVCHMTSSTFQGGCNAVSIASRRVLLGATRVQCPWKTA